MIPTGPGDARSLPKGIIAEYTGAFWLPDGKSILILGNERGRPGRIFRQRVLDGLPEPVTPEDTVGQRNASSPDGAVYAATCPGSHDRFCLYDLSGGDYAPVPGLREGQTPVYWSDQPRQLFVRERRQGVPARFFRLVETRLQRPLFELAPPDRAGVSDIWAAVFTPDGRSYFYSYTRELADLFVVEGLR
jgi:hypothetical protein